MDTSKLNSGVTNINKLMFSETWSGSAFDAQSATLNDLMTKLNQCIADLSAFDAILLLKDLYVSICDEISRLYGLMASCSVNHDDPESSCSCGSYAAQIQELEVKRKALREQIIGLLGQFSGITAEVAPPADLSQPVNPDELEDLGEFPDVEEKPNDGVITSENGWEGPVLTGPKGLNQGPDATETWYDLPMEGVVNNMEKLYGYTNVSYRVREDGVKVLSGTAPDGTQFVDLVMVAADVIHPGHPNGAYERGAIVETSLGTGIVADHCGRSEEEYAATGHIHFDIATAWEQEPYHSQQYG